LPTTTLTTAGFIVPAPCSALGSATLLEALNFAGKGQCGKQQNLLRAGAAALLSAADASVNYPLSTAQVISQVNDALASADRKAIVDLTVQLDAYNNFPCPLN